MKLITIWNAREAFAKLAQLKKPPKLAYRLMKYGRKFVAEFDACEEQRIKCVYEAAGVEPGTPDTNLLPGTPEFAEFMAKFNEFLDSESDLEPVGVGMDSLIESLDSERGNVLTETDLVLIEPFFQEKPPVDLRLVDSPKKSIPGE